MTRSVSLLAALAALALPIAACGGGEDEPESTPEFDAAYAPVNEELLAIGAEAGALGQTQGANTPPREVEPELRDLTARMEAVGEDVSKLEPPPDLADEVEALEGAVDDSAVALQAMAEAAADNDAAALETELEGLFTASQNLNTAQDTLAEATGTEVGE